METASDSSTENIRQRNIRADTPREEMPTGKKAGVTWTAE